MESISGPCLSKKQRAAALSCASESNSQEDIEPLAQILNEASEQAEGSGRRQPFLGLKALVCDDDELNQKIMGRLLAKFGVESEMASNGREGLELLARETFDIVFIDLQMPILNGQEMAKIVRENSDARLASIPLVAVTGAPYYFQEKPLAETSFDDYIVKPITLPLVLQSLERSLQKNGSQR